MNKTVYVIKLIISIVIGVVGGYLLYNLVLMDMVPTILCDTIYVLSSILTMILSMVACTFIVYLIMGLKVHPIVFKVVVALYFLFLLFVLYGRNSSIREMKFNLITSLQELTTDSESLLQFILNIIVLMPIIFRINCNNDSESVLQFILNIIVLMPIAYFFKKKGVIFTELIFLAISFGIEIMQYITARGFFDTLDILCYMVGMNLAYLFFRLTKVDIVKRK